MEADRTMDESLLFTIRAKFLAMVPVRNFTWMESDQSAMKILQNPESQLAILRVTVNSDLCRRYPPSPKYQQAFVKSLVQKCEATNAEVADELYETYTSLLSKPHSEARDDCYRTYLLAGESCRVTLNESTNMISQGTTGLNTWPAASFLTEWALENKESFTGREVLELGSGMGLTGLAVCKMCRPARYVFSDCHPGVLRGLRENVAINLPGVDREGVPENDSAEGSSDAHQDADYNRPDIEVESIDWETVEERDIQKWNAGIILAADVVYDPRIIESLVGLLHRLLCCQGDGQGRPVAFVASTVRNEETYSTFTKALVKHHISTQELPAPSQERLYYDRSCPIKLLSLNVDMT